jgi:Protein of unknown function (DUF2510)
VSGWYPDPSGRYELRFHNGEVWTADVSIGGQRYIDRLPIDPPRRPGNGVAVAAMVCGIASVVIGWIPFVVLIGLAAAIVAIVLGIVGLRRSRTSGAGSGFALTGLITGSVGVLASAVGIVLSVVVIRELNAFLDPGPVDGELTECVVDGSDVVVRGEVENQSRRERSYSVLVEVDAGSVERDHRFDVDDVPAGERAEFSGRFRARGLQGTLDCSIRSIDGPVPFGLDDFDTD